MQRLEDCIQRHILPILQSVRFHNQALLKNQPEIDPDEKKAVILYASYPRDRKTLDEVYYHGVAAARDFALQTKPRQPVENGQLVVDLLANADEEVEF